MISAVFARGDARTGGGSGLADGSGRYHRGRTAVGCKELLGESPTCLLGRLRNET